MNAGCFIIVGMYAAGLGALFVVFMLGAWMAHSRPRRRKRGRRERR